MLKKLQNLLFEEEDEDIEDEETVVEEVEQPAVQMKKETPLPAVKEERVEPKAEVHKEPVVTEEKPAEPVFDSLFAEEEKKPEEKKQTLGITLNPVEKPAPVEKKEETRKTAKKAIQPKKPVATSTYQFKPVISPIFGVDEKDLTAVKNTARKYSNVEKVKTDMNVTPIISPMYGSNAEDSPSLIGDTVEKSEILEKTVGNLSNMKAEDDIPEFSLDDILSSRDEEFKDESNPAEDSSTADISSFFKKEEMDDETKVIDRTVFPSDEGLD